MSNLTGSGFDKVSARLNSSYHKKRTPQTKGLFFRRSNGIKASYSKLFRLSPQSYRLRMEWWMCGRLDDCKYSPNRKFVSCHPFGDILFLPCGFFHAYPFDTGWCFWHKLTHVKLSPDFVGISASFSRWGSVFEIFGTYQMARRIRMPILQTERDPMAPQG